jgi:hypothetical protein
VAAKEAFATTEECRRFLSPEAIATLNGWGSNEKNPIKAYFKFEPGALLIGHTKDDTARMPIGAAFFNELGQLPRIGNISEVQ